MSTTNAATELEKVKEELAEIQSIIQAYNSSDWDGYRNSKGDWNQVFQKKYQNYSMNGLVEKEMILLKKELELLIIKEKGQLMSIPL
jgi:hypothetical protein